MQLDEPLKFDHLLRPVCLPTPGRSFTGLDVRLMTVLPVSYIKIFVFDQGIVTGWGATQEQADVSVTLMEVTVPIHSNEECSQSGYGSSKITENMLCAGYKEGEKDSCQVLS